MIKKMMDFIPLILLVIYSSWEWSIYYGEVVTFQWQTYLGLSILAITLFCYGKKQQYGVLLLGLMLILGFFGLISLSPAIFSGGVIGNGFGQIPFGNWIYLIIFIVHFVVSGRFYFGILTKKYWQILFNRS